MTSSFTSELCVTGRGRVAGCRQQSHQLTGWLGISWPWPQTTPWPRFTPTQTLITTNEKWCSSLPFNPLWQLLIVGSYECVEPLLNLSYIIAFSNTFWKNLNSSNVNGVLVRCLPYTFYFRVWWHYDKNSILNALKTN